MFKLDGPLARRSRAGSRTGSRPGSAAHVDAQTDSAPIKPVTGTYIDHIVASGTQAKATRDKSRAFSRQRSSDKSDTGSAVKLLLPLSGKCPVSKPAAASSVGPGKRLSEQRVPRGSKPGARGSVGSGVVEAPQKVGGRRAAADLAVGVLKVAPPASGVERPEASAPASPSTTQEAAEAACESPAEGHIEASGGGETDHAAAVRCLRNLYGKMGNGFGNDFALDGDHVVDSTNMQYGEITYEGMQALYPAMGLGKGDTFYDLGSGIGKLVLYVAMRGEVEKSMGLEVGDRRHRLAETAAASLVAPPGCAKFELLQEDISRRHYRDACVVLITNLCMDMGVQNRTLDNLYRCEKFRRIVTICPLPPRPWLKLRKTVKISTTWAKVSSWQIYDVLREPVDKAGRDSPVRGSSRPQRAS